MTDDYSRTRQHVADVRNRQDHKERKSAAWSAGEARRKNGPIGPGVKAGFYLHHSGQVRFKPPKPRGPK